MEFFYAKGLKYIQENDECQILAEEFLEFACSRLRQLLTRLNVHRAGTPQVPRLLFYQNLAANTINHPKKLPNYLLLI
jgi:hypothetical protein